MSPHSPGIPSGNSRPWGSEWALGYESIDPMGSVVITGSSGFIGWNLVEGLLRLGWDVTGLDQRPPHEHLAKARGFEFHRIILPSPEFRDLLSTLRPTVVVHAAGPSS